MEETVHFFLKLPHIRVLRVDQTHAGASIITVESTRDSTTCRKCGRKIATLLRYADGIMRQHLPICGSKVFIRRQPKRFRCPFCSDGPTTTPELPWYRPRRRFTNADAAHLLLQCSNSPIADRTKATILGFFKSMPERLRRTVTDVGSAMDETQLVAIEEIFGADTLVIDRFHVARQQRAAADDRRKAALARVKRARSKDEQALLKGVMWYFRKSPTDLTPAERDTLECVFAAAPRLRQADDLRAALTAIFARPYTKAEAIAQVPPWMTAVEQRGVTCFRQFRKLFLKHLNGIANSFRNRDTSGFVAGGNTKIQVLKRRWYGILNLDHLFQRLTLDLSGYARFGQATHTTK